MMYVTGVSYVGDYKIRVRFNDNYEGIVDLQQVIETDHRPIFRELEDMSLFKDFYLEMDTVVWKNGLDLAPEFLRERAINSSPAGFN